MWEKTRTFRKLLFKLTNAAQFNPMNEPVRLLSIRACVTHKIIYLLHSIQSKYISMATKMFKILKMKLKIRKREHNIIFVNNIRRYIMSFYCVQLYPIFLWFIYHSFRLYEIHCVVRSRKNGSGNFDESSFFFCSMFMVFNFCWLIQSAHSLKKIWQTYFRFQANRIIPHATDDFGLPANSRCIVPTPNINAPLGGNH